MASLYPFSQKTVDRLVDPEACAAMANRFADEAKGANFAGLLVDFDHFSLDGEKRSEAAGWIADHCQFERRVDGAAQVRGLLDLLEGHVTNTVAPVFVAFLFSLRSPESCQRHLVQLPGLQARLCQDAQNARHAGEEPQALRVPNRRDPLARPVCCWHPVHRRPIWGIPMPRLNRILAQNCHCDFLRFRAAKSPRRSLRRRRARR